jgi:hypothetical protein
VKLGLVALRDDRDAFGIVRAEVAYGLVFATKYPAMTPPVRTVLDEPVPQIAKLLRVREGSHDCAWSPWPGCRVGAGSYYRPCACRDRKVN